MPHLHARPPLRSLNPLSPSNSTPPSHTSRRSRRRPPRPARYCLAISRRARRTATSCRSSSPRDTTCPPTPSTPTLAQFARCSWFCYKGHARHMAPFATPASVFDNQTRYGYLGDSFFTLRYQRYEIAHHKIFLITLIKMIKFLIMVITKHTNAYF